MAWNKHIINLSDSEKERLQEIIRENKESTRTIVRAKILLYSSACNGKRKTIACIAEELGTTHTTIMTVRTEYEQFGLERAVYRKSRTVGADSLKLNPHAIEQIKELMKETPPDGHSRWTVRLLCEECASRGIVKHVSVSTMHTALKKANIVLKQ